MVKFLIGNDDGIGATGIVLLEKIVKMISDDYRVVAPASHKSGAGHSITIADALIMQKYDDKHYSVNGSPADCISFGISQLYKNESSPDIVLSGINFDRNYGSDVTSSGTVAVAIEGLICGIRSIALSQRMNSKIKSFDVAEVYCFEVLKKLLPVVNELPKNVLLNVNFPACRPDEVVGVKVAKQAIYNQGREVKGPFKCPFGFDYYWQSDAVSDFTLYPQDTDVYLSHCNYITVTPLKIDLTSYESFSVLEQVKW